MASVNFHHALGATQGADSLGIDANELLLKAGINPELANRANARVSDLQMTRLVQNVWRVLGDEFMGFTANKCKPGTFAFMLQAIATNSGLYTALKQGIRFYSLVTEDIDTKLRKTSQTIEIEFQFAQPELDPDYFYHEFWFVIWHRLACWLTGIQIPLIELQFAYPKPKHANELKLMFPCKQVFSANSNKLKFDVSFANAELIRSKQEINAFLRHSPIDLLTIPGFDLSFTNSVKQHLAKTYEQQQYFPNLQAVATALNFSQPTLHRRLLLEGASFQQIKDDLKKDLAIDLLTKDKRPVYEVAERIGFSDARSLTRAFKKWTGLTPREYSQLSNKK